MFLISIGVFLVLLSGCSTSPVVPPNASTGGDRSVRKQERRPEYFTRSEALPALPVRAPTRKIGLDPLKGCTWIESSSTVVGSEDSTPRSLRLKAISRAEEKAMTSFSGVSLTENTLTEQYSFGAQNRVREGHFVEDMLMAEHRALLVDERVLSSENAPLPPSSDCPGCTRESLVLEACLKLLPPGSSRFQVHIKLNQPWYREGEEATLTVGALEGGYLYLFDEDPLTHKYSVIAPNPTFLPSWKLNPGKSAVFPDPQLREEGVSLVAQLPPGETFSSEILRVVVSRDPLPEKVWSAGKGKNFFGVIDWLLSSGIPWGEDAQAFNILGINRKKEKIPFKSVEANP